MQPRTQLSSAIFIPDEMRNDILSRNEIANLVDQIPNPGNKNDKYSAPSYRMVVSHPVSVKWGDFVWPPGDDRRLHDDEKVSKSVYIRCTGAYFIICSLWRRLREFLCSSWKLEKEREMLFADELLSFHWRTGCSMAQTEYKIAEFWFMCFSRFVSFSFSRYSQRNRQLSLVVLIGNVGYSSKTSASVINI